MQSFIQMQKVIFALFLRELKTRFGESRIGVVWVIFEPMAHILTIFVIFSFLSRHMMPQVSFPLFLATGMIPFFLFKNIVMGLISSIDANKSLFAYRPVQPIDTYLSRTLLESLIYISIFVIVVSGIGFLEDCSVWPRRPLEAFGILLIVIVLAFTIGILTSMLAQFFPRIKMIIQMLITILYFVTAIMYPLWILPSEYQDILLYNPLLHLIELFRESFFPYYPSVDGINLIYPIIVTIILLYFGMWFYSHRKLRLAASS